MDVTILRSIPLFAAMDDEHLRQIATFASSDTASEGTVLMRQGDYSTELIAIEDGTADVVRDGQTLATLGPGEVFGEMGVLEKELRTASVIATSRMHLVRLSNWEVGRLPRDVRERLREVIRERHETDRTRPT
jgi:CRP-like cAMP-binding protein